MILLETIRQFLKKQGCKDPTVAALVVTRMVLEDLILNMGDRIEYYKKAQSV